MEKPKTLDAFSTMSVPKAVLKNALPAMAAMLMALIYSLADTFFIGQTHDDYQVAAISLTTPVFLLFMAVGTIFGIGGTSVISRAIGEGRREYAKKVCSFCMWSCVACGVVMCVIFLLFMDNILVLIGASAETWDFAKNYLIIVSYGSIFSLITSCFSNILRAEGQAAKAMMGQIIGNVLNVVLDPILILAFHWNVEGAAIATVIGNAAAAFYYVFYFLRGKSSLSIKIKDFSVKDKICGSVLAIGIPASLASILMSVSQILMNGILSDYGDMEIAGMGVAMKIVTITGLLSMGAGQGIQPLLGYCVGAKTWGRFKKTLNFSLLFTFALGVVLTALCYLFTNQLVSAFLDDEAAFDHAVSFARILPTTAVLTGVFFVLTNALQAMGAAVPSLIVNLSRQGLIYIPALYILNALAGVSGLAWAQPIADILSIGLAIILYIITARKMMKKETAKVTAVTAANCGWK